MGLTFHELKYRRGRSHSASIPTARHFLSRQSWHFLLMYMSISQPPPLLQWYTAFLVTLRLKKPTRREEPGVTFLLKLKHKTLEKKKTADTSEKYLCIPHRWERCSDTRTLCHRTPRTARPDLCSFLPCPPASSAPGAAPRPRGPGLGPRSGARGWDHRGPPGSEGCSGRQGGRAVRRKKRRRRGRRWRRVESRRGRRAGWHGCTVVGCKGAAGGQGPAGGSPEGQPASLKKRTMEGKGQKVFATDSSKCNICNFAFRFVIWCHFVKQFVGI